MQESVCHKTKPHFIIFELFFIKHTICICFLSSVTGVVLLIILSLKEEEQQTYNRQPLKYYIKQSMNTTT